MVKLRVGNDFVIAWQVIVNRGELLLENLDTTAELIDEYGRIMPTETEVKGEYVYVRFLGVDQHTGKYKLTLWINKGRRGQAVVDRCNVINLVPCSDKAEMGDQSGVVICPELSMESVQIAIGVKGDKGDKGDPGADADMSGFVGRLEAQEALNSAQQRQIDQNTDTNIQQEEKLVNEIGDEATDEDIDALFQ